MHRVIVLLFATVSAKSTQPIWDINTSCTIPNESQQGVCRASEECVAYQRINDVGSLGSIGRLSFLHQLQCTGLAEGSICCPQSGNSYREPSISESVPRRIRNETVAFSHRISGGGDELCGQQDYEGKLLGGAIASISEFPWMAMLIYDEVGDSVNPVAPGCGGALISKSFVVTAAHCLVGQVIQKKGNLKFVRLGEYDLNNDPDCLRSQHDEECTEGKVDTKPKRIIPHPEYSPNAPSQHHDIGLVELLSPVQYTPYIQHICLPEPTASNGVSPGSMLNVCGWGRTDFFRNQQGSNALSPVKLKVVLPYFDQQNCREIYRPQKLELGNGQICVGGEKAKDTCAGDSGSPLMFFDRNKPAWVLTGLVSQGVQKCGTVGKPGIYTNVREYLDWIKKTARV